MTCKCADLSPLIRKSYSFTLKNHPFAGLPAAAPCLILLYVALNRRAGFLSLREGAKYRGKEARK